ncbi:hypothetical protein [Aliiroseovarius pelagivivens]|nr:hypothetical protein [Aliiroseovarius pelagivivens]
MAPTTPMAEYASENAISIRYSAYDTVPTLTAEAQDMAVKHCAKYGKFANYRGGNAANALTTEEIHRFACERRKTDDGSVIAGQSRRPGYVIIN